LHEWLAAWLLALGACLLTVLSPISAANAVVANGASLKIQMLDPAAGDVGIDSLSSDVLDPRFQPSTSPLPASAAAHSGYA